MRKRDVYGRRYWPKGVHEYDINKYFRWKNIVDVGCLINEWDETEFNVFILKNTDYNIMVLSNFSDLTVTEGQKEKIRMDNGEVIRFNYPKIVMDHYRYRRAVENHNALSHGVGSKSQIFSREFTGNGLLSHLSFCFFHSAY